MTEVIAPEPGATCDHAHHSHTHSHPSPTAPPAPDTPGPLSGGDDSGALVSDEIRTVYLHPGVMDEFMAIAQVRHRASMHADMHERLFACCGREQPQLLPPLL